MVALLLALSVVPKTIVTAPKASVPVAVSLSAPSSRTPGLTPAAPLIQKYVPGSPSPEADLVHVGGETILGRAQDFGVELAEVGDKLSQSESTEDAVMKLRKLNVLFDNETTDRWGLLRVWHDAADTQPKFSVDASKALTAAADGVTWHVHGIVHGQLAPVGAGKVLKLVGGLKDAGLPLYSEQRLGGFYGFDYGHEVRDFEDGGLQAQGGGKAPGLLSRVLGSASLWVWTGLFLLMEAAARWRGEQDVAHWLAKRAKALFSRKWDWDLVRRTELPMPLNASEGGIVSLRSKLIAQAARADALAKGHAEAHILVGHKHAQEVLWWLTQGPK